LLSLHQFDPYCHIISTMTSIVGGALARRTLPVMADEKIGMAMSKWWKKKRPFDAEVGQFV
jgi:hypothetical protein